MTRHARASSVGSTLRRAARLGRTASGAPADRAASNDAGGSSAPTPPAWSPRRISIASLALAVSLLAFFFIPASISKTVVAYFGSTGSGGGQFSSSSEGVGGAAVYNKTGDVYVVDRGNNRVEQFQANGTFVRAWGEDVVSSGPDNTGTGFEICNALANPTDVCKAATATAGGMSAPQGIAVNQETGNVYVTDREFKRVDEFKANGEFIRAWGRDVVSSGPDNSPAQPAKQSVTVEATGGTFNLGFESKSTGATGTGKLTELTTTIENVTTSTGAFVAGEAISGTGIPPETTISVVNPVEEKLTLSAAVEPGGSGSGVALTAALPYNVTAPVLQNALQALPTVGPSSVTVSGGPGGTAALLATFAGGLNNTPLPTMSSDSSGLSGGSHTATVATTQSGSNNFEICNVIVNPTDVCKTGISEARGGAFSSPFSSFPAVAPPGAPNAGNVIVADPGNKRVQEFTSEGQFVKAFGSNAVLVGPDNGGAANEVQSVKVIATSGTFKLSLSSQTTAALPYNATWAEVQSALDNLATIGSTGGSVTVSGGPGDASGSKPYVVTFGGSKAGTEVGQMTLKAEGLGIAVGTQLNCTTTTLATTIGYRWLRNGAPIGGATASTYTTVTADEGDAIQCQVFAINSNAGATAVSAPATIVSPFPATAPPVPGFISSPSPSEPVAGTTETCSAGSWTGSPTFTYQWYVNGVAVPGATSNTYVVQAADVPGAIQCAVTGENAGGKVTGISGNRRTRPEPSHPAAPEANSTVVTSSVSTVTHGVPALEVCRAASFDVCKESSAGASTGMFGASSPTRVAVDGSGQVYTVENNSNFRVQKFNYAATSASVFAAATLSPPGTTSSNAPSAVAVDPANDHVFVVKRAGTSLTEEQHVLEFDGSANLLETHAVGAGLLTVNGLGVASSTAAAGAGDLYLTSPESTVQPQRVYVLNAAVPPVVVMKPVTVYGGTTATLEGEVNPTGLEASYRFEYSPDGVHWTKAPVPDAALGFSGNALHPVSPQPVSGLTGSQLYHVRLVATKAYAGGSATSTAVTFTTHAAAPAISTQGVSGRTDTAATLEARVNPQNEATHYHFDYIAKADYEADGNAFGAGTTSVPAADASAGSGGAPVTVSQPLSGLAPETTYVFRAVAENPTGKTEGASGAGEEPNATFTTFPGLGVAQNCPNEAVRRQQRSTYLPDCRAFELVNQPEKGTQNVGLDPFADLPATPDGESALWGVGAGAPGANSGTGTTFLAQRLEEPTAAAPNGWQSTALEPPPAEQIGAGARPYKYQGATPDLSRVVDRVEQPGESLGEMTYVRLDRSHGQDVLASLPEGPESGVDLTGDGAHVVLVNAATHQLEDVGTPGAPEVLSVMPGGSTPSACGLYGGSFAGPFPTNYAGGSNVGAKVYQRPGYHMIATTDASRVYFEARPNGACSSSVPLGLYVRNRDAATTTLIDPGMGPYPYEPQFIRTTPDGRSAYYTTYSACRKFSQVSPFGCESGKTETADTNSHADVYRWDEASGESTCITCEVENEVSETKTNVNLYGSLLISDDFSHLYFESTEKLAPAATAGDVNVYALSGDVQSGHSGALRFVADPGPAQNPLSYGQRPQLSANGNVLIFATSQGSRDITADPRSTSCELLGKVEPGKCGELYRYDDPNGGSLACISCLRGGFTSHPGGGARLSSDGSTVAFTSEEALVPSDVNHVVDVYEWRHGSQRLVTDGVSHFATGTGATPQVRYVSANGRDVMFNLVDPGLTGFEADGLSNFYDAREGGGFLPPTSSHCAEDSCQGSLVPAPALEQPRSTIEGRGNVREPKPRCARGKVRRHGRCLKPKHKRGRHHRRAGRANQRRSK